MVRSKIMVRSTGKKHQLAATLNNTDLHKFIEDAGITEHRVDMIRLVPKNVTRRSAAVEVRCVPNEDGKGCTWKPV